MYEFFNGARLELGELEAKIMAIVWNSDRLSVRDVAAAVQPKLAYTTVMTTLDRLFKKGLLERSESKRAFIYWPRLTAHEWNSACARKALTAVLLNSEPSRDLLISTLVDTIGQHDPTLLDELEARISESRAAKSVPTKRDK